MNEIWKAVQGYEGRYEISNLGRVKSLNYNHTKKPKILAPKHHSSGYDTVTLCNNGIHKNKPIHKLVADAFIPNPNNLPQVNHIDGDKSHYSVDNLEWVSASDNVRHAIKNGLRRPFVSDNGFGATHIHRRAVYQFSMDGELIQRWECISDASREYSCRPSSIVNCCQGRNKSLRGYKWSYSPTL